MALVKKWACFWRSLLDWRKVPFENVAAVDARKRIPSAFEKARVRVLVDGFLSDPTEHGPGCFRRSQVRFLCGEVSVTPRDVWEAMACWNRHVGNAEALEMIRFNRQHAEVYGYRVLPGQLSDGDFNEV